MKTETVHGRSICGLNREILSRSFAKHMHTCMRGLKVLSEKLFFYDGMGNK